KCNSQGANDYTSLKANLTTFFLSASLQRRKIIPQRKYLPSFIENFLRNQNAHQIFKNFFLCNSALYIRS
ncbi:hypothetical protein EFV91_22205, partial [Yersinia enterocolitica]|nr:hypothetical protein [Yersinia enterocolitica]EKN5100285.1 hypothetical protein [Yersinia enterocolitica]